MHVKKGSQGRDKVDFLNTVLPKLLVSNPNHQNEPLKMFFFYFYLSSFLLPNLAYCKY